MYQGQLTSRLPTMHAKARIDGGQNFPSSNATVQTQHEDELEAEAGKFALAAQGDLDSVVLTARTTVASASNNAAMLATTSQQLIGEQGLEAEARRHLEQQRPLLLALKEKELRRQADLNRFKSEHHIYREASYPDSLGGHLSFVFAALGIEALLNAYFFQNELGILGGAVTALFVSVVNITVAALLGVAFRYHNYVRLWWQGCLGWATLAVFMFWNMYFNSLISTFRFHFQEARTLAAEKGIVDPSMTEPFQRALGEAMQVFVLNPPFQDLESFLLFFVGVFLAIFAFYKGYTVDDPYPGYGAVSRPYDEAKKPIAPAIKEVSDQLASTLAKHVANIQQVRAELMQSYHRLVQLQTSVETARNVCNDQLAHIILDHAHMRRAYRQTNVSIRTTPAPVYFSDTADVVPRTHDGGCSALNVELEDALVQYHGLQERFLLPLIAASQAMSGEAARLHNVLFAEFLAQLTTDAQQIIAANIVVLPQAGETR